MITISIVNEQDEELLFYESKFLNYIEGRTIMLNDANTKKTSSYKIISITHLTSYVNDGVSEGAMVVVRPIDK